MQQWSRFVGTITPQLGELLTVGLLNEAGVEVEYVGGRRDVDLQCELEGRQFTVEVKTGWWHDDRTVIAHSPLRPTQVGELVAIVGRFSVEAGSPTLLEIGPHELVVDPDVFFYLIPAPALRSASVVDGRSVGRALLQERHARAYEVHVAAGLERGQLLAALAAAGS
ncbi:hypothetical protein NS184_04315 [Curtobacterium luteum]|uniref:Uncharacterized protein n=2 Tax=Curtobacterium luteum TaxID=33881 RepID=A0A175RZ62_9MICO|nr:hypothetical protein NS184_04315 [Curtobacterium luteum]